MTQMSNRRSQTEPSPIVVLTPMDRDEAEYALRRLKTVAARWQGEKVKTLSLSAGMALAVDHQTLSAETLAQESDKAMYEAKAAYYRTAGRDRRNRRA